MGQEMGQDGGQDGSQDRAGAHANAAPSTVEKGRAVEQIPLDEAEAGAETGPGNGTGQGHSGRTGDQVDAGPGSLALAPAIETQMIGGLAIARMTRLDLARLMASDARAARTGDLKFPRFVTSANGSIVAAYHADARLRAAMDQADLIDADGMPLVFASRIFSKTPLVERAATTDFLLDAAALAAVEGISFYFLGGRPGVAARAAEHLRSRFPDLKIAGVRHGYFTNAEEPMIISAIARSGAQILWVGMGSPRQEIFAARAREALPGLAWIRTCGGLFDHYGGGVSRAPHWMQRLGLEWLYRAAREPVRLGWRYLVTSPVALYHLATKTRG